MKNWYNRMSSQIIWDGRSSQFFNEGQGLRQGCGLLAGQCIMFSNSNMVLLRLSDLGFNIGTVYSGCLKCADDAAVIHTDPINMQAAINVCSRFVSD